MFAHICEYYNQMTASSWDQRFYATHRCDVYAYLTGAFEDVFVDVAKVIVPWE